ncbi:MAG: hypothetical protein A2W31_11455 [Planctomycetes bacterium RBG_16_64_10]|nr:MAG: hypothetical protein A2W31_11455 [Planctomycetes bacterium RBG_16_64_10]
MSDENQRLWRLLWRWSIAYAVMMAALSASLAFGDKPALKLRRSTDGTLFILPDLPAGTPYEVAEVTAAKNGCWVTYAWIAAGRPKAATYSLPYLLDGEPIPPGPIPPEPKPPVPPDPKPPAPPEPTPGPVALQVLMVYDPANLPGLGPKADGLWAKSVRDYLDSHCAKDELKRPRWRIWPINVGDVEKATGWKPVFDDAKAEAAKAGVPWIVVLDPSGKKLASQVLPESDGAVLELLQKWGGK